MKKEGQLKLSFGMIFSIILIAIFVAFAFFAIGKFLDIQNSVLIGKFTADLQSDVDRIWRGSQGSQLEEYFLPSGVDYVCIINYKESPRGSNVDIYSELEQLYFENENLFFYPLGSAQGLGAKETKHLDLNKTTLDSNPLCFEIINGKVKVKIKKEFGEALVTLSK